MQLSTPKSTLTKAGIFFFEESPGTKMCFSFNGNIFHSKRSLLLSLFAEKLDKHVVAPAQLGHSKKCGRLGSGAEREVWLHFSRRRERSLFTQDLYWAMGINA